MVAVAVAVLIVVSGLAFTGILFKSSHSSPTATPRGLQVSNETSVIGNHTMSDLSSSGGGYFNFSSGAPGISNLHSGSIVVSGSGDGFLRQVVSVTSSGSGTSVYTVPASLSQVFLNGSLQSTGELNFAGASNGSGHSLAGVPDGGPLFSLSIPFDQVWTTSYGTQVSVSGMDVLSASYVLDANFTLFHGLTGFYFALLLTNQIHVIVSISQAVSLSLSYPIYNTTLDPIVFFAGPVPVVLVPVLDFSVGLDVTAQVSATATVNSSESLAAGLRYASGSWSPVSSESHTITYQLPSVSASLDAKAYLDSPHFVLEFYGVAGPSFTLSPYLLLHGVYPGCPSLSLYAGLEGTAGIDMGFLDDTDQVFSYRLFDLEWLLGQYPSDCGSAVVFSETGLPARTSWSVTLNGTTQTSTSSSINFTEPNGTYSYVVGSVPGYTASPTAGSVTVSGIATNQIIAFTTNSSALTVSANAACDSSSATLSVTGPPGGTVMVLAAASQPITSTSGFSTIPSVSPEFATGQASPPTGLSFSVGTSAGGTVAASIAEASFSASSPFQVGAYQNIYEEDNQSYSGQVTVATTVAGEVIVLLSATYTQVSNGLYTNQYPEVNGAQPIWIPNGGCDIQLAGGVWASTSIAYYVASSIGTYSITYVVSSVQGASVLYVVPLLPSTASVSRLAATAEPIRSTQPPSLDVASDFVEGPWGVPTLAGALARISGTSDLDGVPRDYHLHLT